VTPLAVTLRVPARRDAVASVTANGRAVPWRAVESAVAAPLIEVTVGAAPRNAIVVTWAGGELPGVKETGGDHFVRRTQGMMAWWEPAGPAAQAPVTPPARAIDWMLPLPPSTRWQPIALGSFFNDRVTEIFRPGKYVSRRSPFCSLAIPAQGIGAWAGHVNAMAEIDDRGLRAARANGGRLLLPNGVPFVTPGQVAPAMSYSPRSGTTTRARRPFP
jgi:hypothetical protein